MKALVFSDTHGNRDFINFMIEYVKPDVVIHLGDGLEDVDPAGVNGRGLYMVCGNCDWAEEPEYWKLLDIGGKKALITHGDRFGVDEGLDRLISFALENGAELVLHGHTHRPCVCRVKGVLVVNPGSAMLGESEFSCAVVEVSESEVRVMHIKKRNSLLRTA